MSYRITYMQNGIKVQTRLDGDLADIRAKLRAEHKTLLQAHKEFQLFHRQVSVEAKVAFLENLGDQLSAGVPLSRSLENVLYSLGPGSLMQPVTENILATVRDGKPLSRAMETYELIFGRSAIAMVYASENSGRLGQTLGSAAQYIQNMAEIMTTMRKQLAYPVASLVAGLSSMTFFGKFVLPRLLNSPLLKNASGNDSLSSIMTALKFASTVVPWISFSILATGMALFLAYRQSPERVERLLIKIPWLNTVLSQRAYFVAFSTMSKLLSVGVPLDTSINIVWHSTNLHTVKSDFAAAYNALKQEGVSFARKLNALTAVERSMLEMALTMDRQVANFERVARRFHTMYIRKMSKIGPIIYTIAMILGFCMVAFMISAILLPNLQMMNSLQNGLK